MSNTEQQVPQVVVQGIASLNRLEKVVSRNVNFDYDDLDQADEMREAIATCRNDLFNYNNIVRQHKIQQMEQDEQKQDERKPSPSNISDIKDVQTNEE